MKQIPAHLFDENLPQVVALLRELVEIELPTTVKPAVNRLGNRIEREMRSSGAEVTVFPQEDAGNHLLGQWGNGPDRLLLLSHMDTVFDEGTLAQRPFRDGEEKLFGPGVLDMKASIAMLLAIIRLFKESSIWPDRPIAALFTSDEETGSLTSRQLIERLSAQSAAVFCLEPALSNGAVKTARKGTGEISLHVKGVAAHAGASHEQGRNAIEELAHQVIAVQQMTDYPRGTTVNVGVVRGGTRPNVVPEEAYAQVDFRVSSMEAFHQLQEQVSRLSTHIDGTRLDAAITLNRPPMPRDAVMLRSFEKARGIALDLGVDLKEGSTGGGSDANFVAPLGIPVLDGLGAMGDGAHSEREFIYRKSLPQRARLLSALLLNW